MGDPFSAVEGVRGELCSDTDISKWATIIIPVPLDNHSCLADRIAKELLILAIGTTAAKT